MDPAAPADILSRHRLRGARFVARGQIAHVWKVTTEAGAPAALKVFDGGSMGSEAGAPVLYRHWRGDGAPGLLAATSSYILLDWLEGPPLGDRVRRGDDEGASAILAELGARLHTHELLCAEGLSPIAEYCKALRDWGDGGAEVDLARSVCDELLRDSGRHVGLHGDLHHDNIIETGAGAVAFDPKGVFGDPHFEYSNVFRNPRGAGTLCLDPARARSLAAVIGARTGLDPQRLLRWAVPKAALSLAWSGAGPDTMARGLPVLRALIDAAGLDRA